MTIGIYTKLKSVIASIVGADGLPIYKTVTRYNSQVEHSLKEKNDQIEFLYPACFIQFSDVESYNLGGSKSNIQQCDFITTLHLSHHILLDDDTTDLISKQLVYAGLQVLEFQPGEPTVSRFSRTGEDPPNDESWVLVHKQRYKATLKDFDAVPVPNTGIVTTLTVTT